MASTTPRSAVERPASYSRRDAVVQQFLSLADALARRFQRRFPDLIELDDARQVARYELIRAAACLKPGCCTTAAYLKRRIHGALQHYLRDHGRLLRVSRREHEKGIHPLGHESLDTHGPDERPYLDHLASPESEAPVFESSEGAAEALLERISANEAAILRLRVLEGQSLRHVSREVGGHQCDDRQPPRASSSGGAAGAAGLSASRGRATGPKQPLRMRKVGP